PRVVDGAARSLCRASACGRGHLRAHQRAQGRRCRHLQQGGLSRRSPARAGALGRAYDGAGGGHAAEGQGCASETASEVIKQGPPERINTGRSPNLSDGWTPWPRLIDNLPENLSTWKW